MDLATICDEVSYLANDTTLSSTGTNSARTKAWVREVYFLDIYTLCTDWWFLKDTGTISTVSGTSVYSLPNSVPNVKNLREVYISGSNKMHGISSFEATDLSSTTIGEPTKFWHYDRSSGTDRIKFYPTPDAVYTVNVAGITAPSSLTANADIPTLPTEWHYLLVKGAYVKALKHNQDPNLELEVQEYQALLKRLKGQNNGDLYRTDSWWK
jgi:hypothetical protein